MLDALDRHGYVRGDDQHADRAIGLIGDLARIWDGTQDYPTGPTSSRCHHPGPPIPNPAARPVTMRVVLADGDVSTGHDRAGHRR